MTTHLVLSIFRESLFVASQLYTSSKNRRHIEYIQFFRLLLVSHLYKLNIIAVPIWNPMVLLFEALIIAIVRYLILHTAICYSNN